MKLCKYIGLTIVLLVFGLTTACGSQADTHVIVAGSTSVQPYAELLAEEYKHLYPERAVNVQGGGSSAGIRAVESGIADIGMSSRSLTGSELDLWAVEIAKDALALITHPDNPVTHLTLEQVRGIYTGRITNWSMVGGDNAPIHRITREAGSGTRSAFEEMVMADELIDKRAVVLNSNGAIRQIVAGNSNAIGFISLGLVDYEGLEPVKALELEGVAPTQENVLAGEYNLYRPFLFVAAEEPLGDSPTRLFIDFVLSEDGQNLLKGEGLIPIFT
ncbi:MAG: phosphate ABC transporter substrate-binding protein [Oscillospiraceae bacterium]|nr:phosphate ABC transporter substrate-binding protein [Oscillospiraceae bacterium]